MSDKTEAPSHRRLEEAREEGNVARSLELNTAVIILASAFLIRGQGGQLVDVLKEMMVLTIQKVADPELTGTLASFFCFYRSDGDWPTSADDPGGIIGLWCGGYSGTD